jgi:hypothetical protein
MRKEPEMEARVQGSAARRPRIVLYVFGQRLPEQPIARFTDRDAAREAARALESLGIPADVLSRDESPWLARPSLWSLEYRSPG